MIGAELMTKLREKHRGRRRGDEGEWPAARLLLDAFRMQLVILVLILASPSLPAAVVRLPDKVTCAVTSRQAPGAQVRSDSLNPAKQLSTRSATSDK